MAPCDRDRIGSVSTVEFSQYSLSMEERKIVCGNARAAHSPVPQKVTEVIAEVR
jgi:hypothetical protein